MKPLQLLVVAAGLAGCLAGNHVGAGSSAAAPAATQPHRTVVYSGRVVRSSDGAAVPGAHIGFVPGSTSGVNLWMGCPPTVADADGHFEHAVPVNRDWVETVWLVARAPGWLQREPLSVPFDGSAGITLTVAPAARISGQVLDPAGNGVAAAEVRVHRWDESTRAASNIHPIPYAFADERGLFDLGDMLPGQRIELIAYHRLYAHPRDNPIVAVDAGQHLRDVQLLLPAGARIRVRTVGREGRVIGGVQVELYPAGASARAIADQSKPTHAQTGEMTFWNLRPGRYRLAVSVSEPWHTDAEAEVELRDGEEETVTLRVEPAPTIRGRVLDGSGNPAADVALLTVPLGRPGKVRRARSDERGEFTIYVGDGAYRVAAVEGVAGNSPAFAGEATARGGDTGVTITLRPYTPPDRDRGR